MIGEYCKGFGLLFSNATAVWILLATCFRVWQVQMISNYLPKYMEIYADHQALYSSITAVGQFVGTFFANIMSALIVDKFGKNVMTTPLICVFKALIDLPLICMIFLQQGNFSLCMGGILGEYFFAKGWTSPTVLMLQTVVHPSIKGITVAMFLFFSTLVGAISPVAFSYFYNKYNLRPTV